MEEPRSRKLFTEMVARPDPEVSLAEAALLIACEEYPDLDVPHYLARLDEMGAAVRSRLGGTVLGSDVAALNDYVFREQGFRGNTEDYYDPRNSFLNEVLDRRTGIPITLSIVYIEVAWRGGLRAEGVGLPGHFIVRVSDRDEDLLVDPFHGGVFLSEEDCQKRLDRVFGGKVKMEAGMLAPCDRKAILVRMLRNLKAIYSKRDDYARALNVVELLLRLNPQGGEDLRDRGLIHAALDCYTLAYQDLEAYLSLVPGTPEAAELREKITEMRLRAARLN